MDGRGSIPGKGKGLVQTSSEAHQASHPTETGGSIPGEITRQGRDADHSPPSSVAVKNE
jgi:hypothetical protein